MFCLIYVHIISCTQKSLCLHVVHMLVTVHIICPSLIFVFSPTTIVNSEFKIGNNKKKKKLYGPFLRMGFNCLKARATSRRQFTFPRNLYSFYRPPKDEGLSQPWSHSVVLSMEPLDGEFSALTTRPSLHGKFSHPS